MHHHANTAKSEVRKRRSKRKDDLDGDEEKYEYLIKWKDKSYLHCSWEQISHLRGIDRTVSQRVKRFVDRQYTNLEVSARVGGNNGRARSEVVSVATVPQFFTDACGVYLCLRLNACA